VEFVQDRVATESDYPPRHSPDAGILERLDNVAQPIGLRDAVRIREADNGALACLTPLFSCTGCALLGLNDIFENLRVFIGKILGNFR